MKVMAITFRGKKGQEPDIAGYALRRNGAVVGSIVAGRDVPAGTDLEITDQVQVSGTYRYTVEVVDEAGNVSVPTAAIIEDIDLTAPTTPAGWSRVGRVAIFVGE